MLKRRIRVSSLGALSFIGLGLVRLVGPFPAGLTLPRSPAFPAGCYPEPLPEPPQTPELVVHEWDTFLGVSGSDGTVLDGMYHEEHALPSFVHARSRDQLRLPFSSLKGETPVIYFYTRQPQSLRLGVTFPRGVWTQWYPQTTRVEPSLVQQAEAPDRIKNGHICWSVSLT